MYLLQALESLLVAFLPPFPFDWLSPHVKKCTLLHEFVIIGKGHLNIFNLGCLMGTHYEIERERKVRYEGNSTEDSHSRIIQPSNCVYKRADSSSFLGTFITFSLYKDSPSLGWSLKT